MATRVNVGCGASPTPGWINLDNSLSIVLSRAPDPALRALTKLRVLNAGSLGVIDAARRFGIQRASATNLPFQDASVDVIYTSHMLEHLDRETARRFLKETQRVLRPGGWIRIAVPDLERYVREYDMTGDADAFVDRLRLAVPPATGRERFLQRVVGFRGHRWMYDSVSLLRLLESYDFTEIGLREAGETHIPDVSGLDLREREGDSIYAEGRKG
jgi:predicted SAM-dependent methyltransferase